jgi:hypothetical protein
VTITHQAKAAEYLKIAERWGFKLEIQQRVGVLVIIWGLFETKLELAVWRLRDEEVAGRRPSTDGRPLGELIEALGAGTPKLGEDVCNLLSKAATAAANLMHYRHSLVHGHMIPSDVMPSFLRNASWYGEIRRRPPGEAFISENLLDMAIDATGTLCRVVLATDVACRSPAGIKDLMALERDVRRADSQAGELRHLAALMNHEKY